MFGRCCHGDYVVRPSWSGRVVSVVEEVSGVSKNVNSEVQYCRETAKVFSYTISKGTLSHFTSLKIYLLRVSLEGCLDSFVHIL